MSSWRLRLLMGAAAMVLTAVALWFGGEAASDTTQLTRMTPHDSESAAPRSVTASQSVVSSPKGETSMEPRGDRPLSAEQMRIADDRTRIALKEMKDLERARTQLFWRSKTENGGIYIHALLPPPDAQQIEKFSRVLQENLVHEDPVIIAKLQKRKQQLYQEFMRFPSKFRFITAGKLPTGEGRIIENSINDPRNLEKRPRGTVRINEMTGSLPYVGPGLLNPGERYDYLLEYADVEENSTRDLPPFVEEPAQGEKR